MSLFPFLAVLVCTMGGLIVLLVVISRQARLAAAQHVLSEDPGEQHNRIAERRELADSLSAELDRMLVGRIAGRAGRGSGSGAVMTEQQKEVLRSLGYIGGAKGDSSTGAGGAAAQDTTGTANDR